MNDELKGKCFRDLLTSPTFEAQLVLEADYRTSMQNKLLTLNLNEDTVALEYARIRGAIEALNALSAQRERLAIAARSSQTNS